MIRSLAKLLVDGINPALRYQSSSRLPHDLAQETVEHFKDEEDLISHFPYLATLIMDYDYRLVAEYLVALKNHNELGVSKFHKMLSLKDPVSINKQRYQLTYDRFANTTPFLAHANLSFTSYIEDVFTCEAPKLIIYLHDKRYQKPLTTLIDAVGTGLTKYIEQQYDVPGLNAVVRQGLVRTWHLPNGTAVISKCENQQKKTRFRKEQCNYVTLTKRLGKRPIALSAPSPSEENISVQIAQPIAAIYDGYSGHRYALFVRAEGIPLEDILLIEQDRLLRKRLLLHYRLILDKLYEKGVLWGDMSPRNILMEQQGQSVNYTLVDFEKTLILDEPISLEGRIEHCRGQICVEELGVLCPQEELLMCFAGYFNPSEWDLESEANLPFPPRPDIADVLQGRGIRDVKLGTYNTIDKDFISVRKPDIDPLTKVRRFPGHLGFKVEHYLSCSGYLNAGDYDRKTTEVLITAKQQHCFDDVVAVFAYATNALESAFLKAEFMQLLRGGFSGNVIPPRKEIKHLVSLLDAFYQAQQDNIEYQYLIAQWRADEEISVIK